MIKAILSFLWRCILRVVDWALSTDYASPSAWGEHGFGAHCDRAHDKLFHRTEEQQFEDVLSCADHAWQLPEDYFRRMLTQIEMGNYPSKYPDVDSPVGRLDRMRYQGCPHNIMSGCHPSYSEAFRERLWADPRWRQGLAHVFSIVPVDEAYAVASRVEDGYNRPVSDTILRAIEEGLFGHKWEAREENGELLPGLAYPTAVGPCESQTPVETEDSYW